MVRSSSVILGMVAMCSTSYGEDMILEHNPNLHLGTHYAVAANRTVTILQTIPGETFEFEAIEEDAAGKYVGPIDIEILTNPNVGTVTMTLVGHDGHTHGARDVLQIDLDEVGVTSTITNLKTSGDFGTTGPIVADTIGTLNIWTLVNDITCGSLFFLRSNTGSWAGTIEVAGDVFNIEFFAGSVTGTIHVGGNVTGRIFAGGFGATGIIQIDVDCAGLLFLGPSAGSITIDGDLTGGALIGAGALPSTVVGSISVGNVSGSLAVVGSLGQSGSIEVLQDVSGQVSVGGELLGPLHVFGNCTSSGGITVGTDLKGSITIDGDLAGSIDVGGELNDVFLGSGFIAVDGSYASTAAITIQEGFATTTEFISCNNNGAAPGVWESGATVTLWDSNPAKTQVFTADAPGERVRAATSVKGDMNNDGSVNGGDIDLFFFALGDPAAYKAAYPGLAGSLLYHGDCNCDAAFNGADIGPFFDLLAGGDPCVGFNFWEPEYVAWLIETHVRPDRLDRAIALIDDYTRGEARPDRRRFWNAVLDILAPS